MNTKQLLSALFILFVIITINSCSEGIQNATLKPVKLNCEYRNNPVGLDIVQPRLAWNLEAVTKKRGRLTQTAYHILVASSPALLNKDSGDIWNSGKVLSDQTNQVTYQGKKLYSRLDCYWKVMVWDQDGNQSDWSNTASWIMGLLQPTDWKAHWISSTEGAMKGKYIPAVIDPNQPKPIEPLPTPRYLRKKFTVQSNIKKAMLYVTALGLYEVRLNGNRVGDHLLTPEWTSYGKRVQVDAIDVTKMLNEGNNAIGAIVSNGWYCGNFQFWPIRNRIFGDRPWFYAQLEVETNDGKLQSIVTDSSWHVTTNGPLRQSGIYEGETYDAAKNIDDWDKAGFNESAWQPALIRDTIAKPGKLVWQRNEPIRITKELKPVSVNEISPGVYVYDLGQNISGWARIKAQAAAGATVTLKYAEALNPDGTLWRKALWREGANIAAIDRYTFSSNHEETFEPHFTYHGFRYIEVSGLPGNKKPTEVVGCFFHTNMEKAGNFRCSDSSVTRLVENTDWSQQANYMGIPTDCDNRDERTGVTGDHQFFYANGYL